MKASVFIATSLDGFIARPDGGIDWLPQDENDLEDHGYSEFFNTVDALVMGRNTYETVRRFGHWPYQDKAVFILSSGEISIPEELQGTVEQMAGSPTDIARKIEDKGYHHLYIDGGKTIQGFLEAGLIHQLIITTIPVLIGSGIPLFGSLSEDILLVHKETRTFQNGLVQSRYVVS